MAGRKPKPTALKKLKGNPGKRKLNMKEPVPAKGMGKVEERCRVDRIELCEESLVWFEGMPVVDGDEPMAAGFFPFFLDFFHVRLYTLFIKLYKNY